MKRCIIPGCKLVPEVLRPGAVVSILARQLYIVDFADEYTQAQLGPQQERQELMDA